MNWKQNYQLVSIIRTMLSCYWIGKNWTQDTNYIPEYFQWRAYDLSTIGAYKHTSYSAKCWEESISAEMLRAHYGLRSSALKSKMQRVYIKLHWLIFWAIGSLSNGTDQPATVSRYSKKHPAVNWITVLSTAATVTHCCANAEHCSARHISLF